MPNRQAVLAERYRDALIDVRKRVSSRVDRSWRDLGSWRDDDVARFQARVLPVVAAGQRRTVALTDAYLARAARTRPVGLVADDLIGAAVRNGTDPATVYARPFVQLWSALAAGSQFADALNAAGARAAASSAMDVSLTMRASAQAFTDQAPAEAKPWRWVRVPSGESCALCVVASTQLYRTPDLLALHDNCDCGVEPVSQDTEKAARDRNRELLNRLKSQDSYTTKHAELRHLRVDEDGNFIVPEPAVQEHGELGLVLTDSAHDFTGPADIAA